ncbi:MAG: hypothetical protein ACO30R_07900, partial [Ilumatobacteraceae bacterium]
FQRLIQPRRVLCGKAFRERAVSRLLPPESATIDVVAKDTGVSSDTLERWRNEVLAEPARQTTWTAAAGSVQILSHIFSSDGGFGLGFLGLKQWPHVHVPFR